MAHLEDKSEKPPESLIGRVIGGNFRIESLLGVGGMGNVYRAEQLSLGKAVAVKVLHRELMGDETVVKRFEREAKSASRLDHPNLVQIIDFGHDKENDVLFISMELLTGRDLAQVIVEDAPLPLHRIVRIMSQVLSALEEAHLQGVIHRDLKPANIMLVNRRGEVDLVKVCDFGIAKAASPLGNTDPNPTLTVRGYVCGTPEYMAPEQARGEDVDGRTDLYAAAVIVYQLVTGQVPFTASSPVGILSRHLDAPPTPASVRRPDIPPALDALILRGLSKNPDHRPQTASLFRQELEAVCSISAQGRAETTIHSLSLAAVSSTTKVERRAPASSLKRTAFLGGVLLGVAAAALTYLHGRAEPPATLAAALIDEPRELPPAPSLAPPPPPVVPAVAVDMAIEPPRPTPPKHRARPRPAPAPAPAPAAEPPAPARDPLKEAEALLAQGEVAQACARGEEARQSGARSPAVFRFLGKCYMRAGYPARASENYRVYLELAPNATDAAFIKSIAR